MAKHDPNTITCHLLTPLRVSILKCLGHNNDFDYQVLTPNLLCVITHNGQTFL
jgi:hypothetical protein